MDVWMVMQILSPCMKNSGKTERSAEIFFVLCEFLQGFGDLGMAVVVGKVFGQRVAHGDEVDGGVASEVVKHVACAEGYPLPFFVEGGVGAKAVDSGPEHQRHFLHQVAAAFAVAVAVFPADGPDDFLVSADECGVGFV